MNTTEEILLFPFFSELAEKHFDTLMVNQKLEIEIVNNLQKCETRFGTDRNNQNQSYQ